MTKEQVEVAPKVLVIEMVNQQPSNYVMDGTGIDDNDLPTHISAPNARKLKSRSKVAVLVKEGPDKGLTKLRPIRYIKGCDSIFVDEQDRMGYKPDPANDVIWMLNGKLTVIRNGADIGLYDYIKNHEGNTSNPNRPEGAIDIFQEIDTNLEAQEDEKTFEQEFVILKYLNSLKAKKGDRNEYNEDAINFLCSLFKLPAFDPAAPSESWVTLAYFAKENPKRFLNSLANHKAVVESEVNQALSNGIIVLDETKAMFQEGNKVITGFNTGMSSDDRKARLVDFMTNPAHRLYYDQMRSALHGKKMGAVDIVS